MPCVVVTCFSYCCGVTSPEFRSKTDLYDVFIDRACPLHVHRRSVWLCCVCRVLCRLLVHEQPCFFSLPSHPLFVVLSVAVPARSIHITEQAKRAYTVVVCACRGSTVSDEHGARAGAYVVCVVWRAAAFQLGKYHKDVATTLVAAAADASASAQQVVKALAMKTKTLVDTLKTLGTDGGVSLEQIRARKMNPAMESFLWNVANAEGFAVGASA